MRWKIIIVNAGIVVMVGLLCYVILLTTLGDALSNPTARKLEAERATRSANTQLTLDGLRAERWLSEQADSERARAVFTLGTGDARSEAATAHATDLVESAAKHPLFARMQPTLALFVDRNGMSLGRNNTALMRGDRMIEYYPTLESTLKVGQIQSAIWLNPQRQEQLFTSYAPVRAESGEILGAIVLGFPINDDRLDRISQLTSGDGLVFAVKRADDSMDVIARSRGVPNALAQGTLLVQAGLAVIQQGKSQVIQGQGSHLIGAAPLNGYVEAQGALMAVVPVSLMTSIGSILWPIWGVTALGVLMVIVAGSMIAAYISRPISQLEDGLLMIINGKTDMRFELEHTELGGLVFRINSLLNALMGVPETADDEHSDGS